MILRRTVLFCIVSALIFAGCQTTYYAMWEKLGKEKRHLLRDNVQEASDAQKEASEQFKDTLARLKEMYGFQGGDLEGFYEKFKADFEKSEVRAETVHKRITAVEDVADDLFKEWQNEITQISNPRLRAESSQTLGASKRQYTRLRQAMRKAESKIDPVMIQFRDNLLYLSNFRLGNCIKKL